MGKTIQTLALIASDKKKPNLIVAYVERFRIPNNTSSPASCRPTVAIMQWKNEIEAFTEGYSVLVWHGASRESKIKELQKFDVVCLMLNR